MAKKRSNFKGKVSKDSQRQQNAASSYGHLLLPKHVNVFSADPGSKIKLDILPYEVTDAKHPDRDAEFEIAIPGTLWYKRPYRIHRNIGSANDSVVCPASAGGKCPICEYRAKLIKEGADKEETDALKTSLRNLYVVVPVGSSKHEEKPHIFDISQFLFQNLLNEELEENEDYEIFPDLEEGLTLKVRFDSKTIGSGNAFAEASRIDFLERDEAYDESIIDTIPNLDKVLKIHSYEELEMLFFELEEEQLKDADEEADEKPIRRKKKVAEEEEDDVPVEKPRRRKMVEKEEEEEEQPVEKPRRRKMVEKEEEEEEQPVRRKRKEVAEDDDEDIDKLPFKESKKGGKEKCPHGHQFGVDTDKYEDCDDCKLWDACIEQKESE